MSADGNRSTTRKCGTGTDARESLDSHACARAAIEQVAEVWYCHRCAAETRRQRDGLARLPREKPTETATREPSGAEERYPDPLANPHGADPNSRRGGRVRHWSG